MFLLGPDSSTMADTENPPASEEKDINLGSSPSENPPASEEKDIDLGSGPSSPTSPQPAEDQEPPPYSEAPVMYPADKTGVICTQISTGPQSCSEANPDVPEDPSPFEDKMVRRAFIRKVFCIVTLMLLFTFTVVCVFTFSQVVRKAVQRNIWVYVSSVIVFLVVFLSLSLCKTLSRRHPWNIVAMSYMVGTIASYHDTAAVVFTMGATLHREFITISVFCLQNRYDFTICSGLLVVLVVDLLMFAIFSSFYYYRMLDIVYGCLGALLFALFLMIDVQLLTGSMSYRTSPEDYVSAALTIYLDIVFIFLYLLGRSI
uniref:Si:ch211-284o19.8 n=1 Tax=Myripristis murdjan TaxID=586833 RepID=A0A668AXH4_9TELE